MILMSGAKNLVKPRDLHKELYVIACMQLPLEKQNKKLNS